MTEDIFDLSQVLVQDPSIESDSKYELEYAMFVDDLISLSEAVESYGDNELFTEAKVEPMKSGMTRAKDLTKGAVQAYDDTTTGMGNVIYGGTKLAMKLVGLSTKVIKFVCNMISIIPNTISTVTDDIGRITANAFNQFTGKISIYITSESLDLFDKEIKQEIDHFIQLCGIFSTGDKWTTGLIDNNFKRYRQMKVISTKLSAIRYESTSVNLKSEAVRNIYFKADSPYYQRLQSLNTFFKSKEPELKNLQKALETKIANSENNGSFYKLSSVQQLKANDAVKMIAQFMTIVGKYHQYVQQDLMTLSTQIKRATGGKTKSKSKV